MSYTRTKEEIHKKTGFKSTTKIYQADHCSECAMRELCTKSKEKNRTIIINEQWGIYKEIAHRNLHSEKGLELRRRRGHEIESCFGDLKHNMGFRRFHLRGLKKVKTEVTVVAMAHNLRKIHLLQGKQAA